MSNAGIRMRLCCLFALSLPVVSASPGVAGEWPQILGPHRNGVADDERLGDSFPAKGPPRVWQKEVGEGFSGIAVADSKAIVFHRVDDEERVQAFEAATGQPLWLRPFPTRYSGGISPDNGPRCTPVIDRGRVFVLGAAGDLHCLSLADGTHRWSRSTARDFSAPEGYFGIGSTPIVDGDRLLVNVGGKSNAGIVAFSVEDGSTLWQATDEQASYSSPVAVTREGVRHVVFVTRLSALSVDPENGKVRWKFPFGARGPTVNAANPIILDDHLFLTASYGVGAVYARFGKDRAQTVWDNNDTMSSQYTTSVPYEGNLYGIDGRSDQGSARLRCFDPDSGKVRWTKSEFGMASLIVADGKLVILRENGDLVLAAASPEAYRELGRSRVLSTTARALPALAGGLLYVRDTKTLKCVDLRPAQK